ncbi:MAG: NAD(+) synthase [Eubacteriales bacterium]
MKHGFIKAAAASTAIKVADTDYNAGKVIEYIEKAKKDGINLLVLPELTLTGYTCGDLFLQSALLDGALAALGKILLASRDSDTLIVLGLPVAAFGKLYNCAAVISDGTLLGLVPKKNLPNYSEFYEVRHFTPAPDTNKTVKLFGQNVPFGSKLLFRCEELPDFCVAAEICEDLWVPQPPSVLHTGAGATIIVNPSASDETIGKEDYRRELIASQSARLLCGYVYADAGEGESTTDMVFSGHNLICENGIMLSESKPFGQGYTVSEIDVRRLAGERRRMSTYAAGEDKDYLEIPFHAQIRDTELTRRVDMRPFVPSNAATLAQRADSILAMQTSGLKKRLMHTKAKSAVIAVSGGLDSTLALLITVRVMDALERPRTDVIAVTMPCFGTTARTKGNAEQLCERLGVTLRTIDITAAVRQHFSDIGHDEDKKDVVYENVQARERTQIIMDIANQTGGFVIGTGDLSELALGWATYNGDHMSMYGVNSSVPKTLIRHIVKYYADTSSDTHLREVLLDILDTPVSPELLPHEDGVIAQKTEELVGPYELHDFFLYYAVRWAFPPSKVYRLAKYAFDGTFAPEVIHKWLKVFYRRFFSQQFKRSCLPDGPKIGSVTLSPRADWRMPSDASASLWLEESEILII